MKFIVVGIFITLAAAQQLQQARDFAIPIRLAGLGEFQSGINVGNQQRIVQTSQSGVSQGQTQISTGSAFDLNQVSRGQQSSGFSSGQQISGIPIITIGGSQQQRPTPQILSTSITSGGSTTSTSSQSSQLNRPTFTNTFSGDVSGAITSTSSGAVFSQNSPVNRPSLSNTVTGSVSGSFSSGSSGSGFSQNSQLSRPSLTNAFPGSGSISSSSSEVTNGVFEPLNLPSGASRLLGSIDTSFSCVDKPYGYYADQDNSCRVFHVCYPALFEDGRVLTSQYSFMCGEGSLFDQNSMICASELEATPCQEAANFYFRNEQFGRQ